MDWFGLVKSLEALWDGVRRRKRRKAERLIVNLMRLNNADTFGMKTQQVAESAKMSVDKAESLLTGLEEEGMVSYRNGRWYRVTPRTHTSGRFSSRFK